MRLIDPKPHGGRLIPLPILAHTTAVGPHLSSNDLLVDEIVCPKRPIRPLGPPVGGQRPHNLLVAEVTRHPHLKKEHVTSREKVSWLSAVRPARNNVVLWADRYIDFFVPVVVHVSEEQRVGAIVVLPPSLERRRHALPTRVRELRTGAHRDQKEYHRDSPQ